MSDVAIPLAYPLPWQQAQWQQLRERLDHGQLPHALLLTGRQGCGAEQFAMALAQLLCCTTPAASGACGRCKSCGLLQAGSLPDLRLLQPEKPGGMIKIDAVREVVQFAHMTAQQGGRRVVLLQPAEAMNVYAANSLLKLLEEPGADTHLLLVSNNPSALLPTIKSRCQQLPLPTPTTEQAQHWLQQVVDDPVRCQQLLAHSGGVPLLAKQWHFDGTAAQLDQVASQLQAAIAGEESAVSLAASWQAVDSVLLCDWLYARLALVCRQLLLPDAQADAITDAVVARRGHGSPIPLLDQLQQLLTNRRQLSSGANPNEALQWEALLMKLLPVLRGQL